MDALRPFDLFQGFAAVGMYAVAYQRWSTSIDTRSFGGCRQAEYWVVDRSGWDEGVLGMKIGECARLTCTPDYAYGAGGFPAWGIMPNATVRYSVVKRHHQSHSFVALITESFYVIILYVYRDHVWIAEAMLWMPCNAGCASKSRSWGHSKWIEQMMET
eukprot:2723987-Pyramimonas_sp.AAC.3